MNPNSTLSVPSASISTATRQVSTMQEFIEIPATAQSLAFRRPLLGTGINDANYMVRPKINGKHIMCPYYQAWANMIERSYSEKYQETHPAYVGCSVIKEWLIFSNFRKWMKKQGWEGKQLDKDILSPDNKVYGPDTCIFVSQEINLLLNNNEAIRGDYPQGVHFRKDNGKYRARCSVNGKLKRIGQFSTVPKAEYAYCTFKASLIKQIAYEPEAASNPKLQSALLRHAEIFTNKSLNLRIKAGEAA